MLRQQVIRLYREFFRATAKLEDGGQKEEIRSLIRADFKANQSLDTSLDEDKVKSLLFHGEKMLRELQQNVDLSKAWYIPFVVVRSYQKHEELSSNCETLH